MPVDRLGRRPSSFLTNGLATARFSLCWEAKEDKNLNWIEIAVHTSREAGEAVSALLTESGADGVAIEDPEVLGRDWSTMYGEIIELSPEDYPEHGIRIKAYLSECEQGKVPRLLEEIRKGLDLLRDMGLDVEPGTVETKTVSEESWENEWKKYYKTLKVTDRLVIKPIWEEYEAQPGEQVIELDPGMAFGTGTHPTTYLSMQLLEKWLQPGAKVIDVGCGSGILSIVAAKLGAKEILALDLDPLAVEKAKENIGYNAIDATIRVEQGDLLRGVAETADAVVANILADIILRMAHDLPRVLRPGGVFIASGIIEQRAEEVLEALKLFGLQVLEVVRQEGWVAIAAKKW